MFFVVFICKVGEKSNVFTDFDIYTAKKTVKMQKYDYNLSVIFNYFQNNTKMLHSDTIYSVTIPSNTTYCNKTAYFFV